MARINTPNRVPAPRTHEGAIAPRLTAEKELRRTVMACLLWEDSYYEDGQSVADRIKDLVPKVPADRVAQMAIEARSSMHLRHVPLLLMRELARIGKMMSYDLASVIQRPDELTEFLAIYWKDKKQPLSRQVKLGLAQAFTKFGEYQLAKYNRDGAIKLRDVLFLCHAKPLTEEQAAVWKRLVEGTLVTPDTWEVELSAGKTDKLASWTRLLTEKKLGGLALLRNLRNMVDAKVPKTLMNDALLVADVSRVLPFRFIAAARHAPQFEPQLEGAMFRSLDGSQKLMGNTLIMVDVSGSMDDALSSKSDMTRMDAASGLAMVARELCEDTTIVTFSNYGHLVASRRGFALRDAIISSQQHSGTFLAKAMDDCNKRFAYDRVIVITDEQTHDGVADPNPNTKAYMLNVGTYQNGIGYGKRWLNISGFSESIFRYIIAAESER